MAEKKHIDSLVKDRLAERKYVFKEAYWEQAEALMALEEKKRKRKAFLLWWFGMGGIPVMVLGIGTWLVLQTNEGSQAGSLDPLAVNQWVDTSGQHTNSSPSEPAEISHFPVQTINQTTSVDSKEVSAQQAKSQKSESHDAEYMTSSPNKSETSALQPPLKRERIQKKGKINDHRSRSSAEDREPLFQKVLSRLTFKANRNPGVTSRQIPSRILIPAKANKYELNELKQRSFDWEVPIFQVVDSSGIVLQGFPQKRHFWGIDIGTTLSSPWNNTADATSPLSAGLMLGLRYEYEVKPGFRLLTGLRYSHRAGLNSDKTYVSREFRFGLEEQVVVQKPNRFHMLELPLLVDFHLHNRHYLQLGGQLSYLMNVSGTEEYFERSFSEESMVGQEQVWGLSHGFRSVNPELSVGYGYYLGNGLRMGMQLNASLLDMTDNNFFENERIHRNLQLRLMLSKDLIIQRK